jgi:DNA-binding NarL/FixJ family response regulator
MRAMIAEDSVLLREGISRLLVERGWEVPASCAAADELLARVDANTPDVVIVDIRMPPTYTDEGLRAALTLRERYPGLGVLVLSQYVEVQLAMRLLADAADGVGYLLKDRISDVSDFLDSVHRVATGGSAIDPQIVSALISIRRHRNPLSRLTPREGEVLTLMAEGRSNQGIASELHVTLRAVEKYVSNIFAKLDMPTAVTESKRVLAVLLYLRG